MKTPSIRSILFVPADSERKIEKSATSGADAVVLDLEDSVSQSRLGYARDLVLRYLSDTGRPRKQQLWVRVNPLRSAFILDDLAAVVRGAPDAMLLPKCAGGADVTILDHYLTALERRDCIDPGHIRTVPVATESPEAMFGLNSYKGCSERLLGLTWGAEDLASAVGASTCRGQVFSDTLIRRWGYASGPENHGLPLGKVVTFTGIRSRPHAVFRAVTLCLVSPQSCGLDTR